ncbi:Uncharacterized protein Rs2_25997 [Raphanus sativus]|nr:Uncharacterized protein Rs2_25997 [Raphanus sativus]
MNNEYSVVLVVKSNGKNPFSLSSNLLSSAFPLSSPPVLTRLPFAHTSLTCLRFVLLLGSGARSWVPTTILLSLIAPGSESSPSALVWFSGSSGSGGECFGLSVVSWKVGAPEFISFSLSTPESTLSHALVAVIISKVMNLQNLFVYERIEETRYDSYIVASRL